MSKLENLEPKEVFHWFYELNQHPRCSGEEKEVSDFLMNFAKERDLEAYQDEVYNVIIKKPGTEGYEDSETMILQGHMDMVCVKGEDSDHDFSKDPIEMIVDGDYLKANDTTLGADDGIAVAYMLAVLDSDDLSHPPLEILVTTSEETGMDGVHALENTHLTGKTLVNIDSEEEGIFLTSCAGGANKITRFSIEKEKAEGEGLEVSISGLKGGHSGMEIVQQRANAIKLMGRILQNLKKKGVRVSSFTGGIKHNAIPSIANAKFTVDSGQEAMEIVKKMEEDLKEEYHVEEPDLNIEVKEAKVEEVFTQELSDNLMDFIMIAPDGVQYMSKDIEGLVQTSLNNAIVEEEDGKVKITTSVRSSSDSSLREILSILEVIAGRTGADIEEKGNYPAWQFEEDSPVRDRALKVYKDLFDEEAEVSAIHAGLECGLLKEILPDTDMLSFGPNLYDVHTEKEHISIPSARRVWEFLVGLLEESK